MPLNAEMLSEALKHSGYNEDISVAIVRERPVHLPDSGDADRLDAASRAGGGHD